MGITYDPHNLAKNGILRNPDIVKSEIVGCGIIQHYMVYYKVQTNMVILRDVEITQFMTNLLRILCFVVMVFF